jgi:tetratricopeptide (TPR) repeat protein
MRLTTISRIAAMPVEVLVRFGRWDEILAAPEPPEYLPMARAMRHCARGIAFAAKEEVGRANAEQRAFLTAKSKVPESVQFGNNTAADILAVAQHMMAGEILYREGKVDEGLAELRAAVKLEDQLRYSEPPDWIQSARHALGATLLHAGRAAEAEKVYREDLALLPNNGWSLYGLSRSLYLQGKSDEARQIEARFHQAWRDADVKITSSCYCQPER